MRTRLLSLGLLLALLVHGPGARAQDCPDNACGDLTISYNAAGSAVIFCEGSTIIMQNNSAPGFDFFVINWGDESVDTVDNYNPIGHTYDLAVDSTGACNERESFNITFRGVASCEGGFSCQQGSLNFGIRPKPRAFIGAPLEVCTGDPVQLTNFSCNATGFVWTLSDGRTLTDENPEIIFDTPGDYTVSLEVSGVDQCSEQTDGTFDIMTVVNPPNALFSLSDDDGVACRGSEITLTNQSNDDTQIRWSISPDSLEGRWTLVDSSMTMFDDSITVRFDASADYEIKLTGSNACNEVDTIIPISIQEAPTITLAPPMATCDSLTLSSEDLNVDLGGAFSSVSWTFENATPATASGQTFEGVVFDGPGRATVTVVGACGDLVSSVDIPVDEPRIPRVDGPDQLCAGSASVTLSVNLPGGRWSGTGIADATAGQFDPTEAEIGDNVLTYTLTEGSCRTKDELTITVVESEPVMTENEIFCIDGAARSLVVSPAGGTWEGEGVGPGGVFDPAVSGVGTFRPRYRYEDGNQCLVEARPTVEVQALPTLALADTGVVCLVDEPVDLRDVTGLMVAPANGIFTWIVNGDTLTGNAINPSNELPNVGAYPITVAYARGACRVADSAVLNVIQNPDLMLDPVPTVCINEGTLQLVVNVGGGVWSGPGVEASTGLVDLAEAGGGDFEYVYTFQRGTSCEQAARVAVTIEDPGSLVSAGRNQEICEGDVASTFELSGGAPTGGVWSGPGVIDGNAGSVQVSALQAGETYEYTYSFETMGSADCGAMATKSVVYNPQPVPAFTIDTDPCLDQTFTLTATDTLDGATYEWQFGDGTTATGLSATHAYDREGAFSQELFVTSAAGCSARERRDVRVTTPPVPMFVTDSLEGCAPFLLDLPDNSSGEGIESRWIVGTDTFPGGQNLQLSLDSFLRDTTVIVRLEASNFCGARTQEQEFLIRPYPAARFGFDLTDGCSPYRPAIANATLGNPDAFLWDFGQGRTSTDSIPQLPIFTTPADSVSTYSISLTATNVCGTGTVTEELTVNPPDVRAFISLDTLAGCAPWTYQPESFSTPGARRTWTVTDSTGATVATGSALRPTFTLTEPGVYRTVLGVDGCGIDFDTVFVEVFPAPPLSLPTPPPLCLNQTVEIVNPNGNLIDHRWQLLGDDGAILATSTSFAPDFVTDSVGTFRLSYQAGAAGNSCPAAAIVPVEVLPKPSAVIETDLDESCVPLTTTLVAGAAADDDLAYNWQVGDGQAVGGEPVVTVTYDRPGVYTPQLELIDVNGCRDTFVYQRIRVNPNPAIRLAIRDSSLCAGNDTLVLADLTEGVANRQWSLNGRDYPRRDTLRLADLPIGTYLATLAVDNSFGCTDSTEVSFTVAQAPQVALTIPEPSVCEGTVVSLFSTAESADELVWDLGDGSGSRAAELDHEYAIPGTYAVRLIGSNTAGCADTARAEVIVHPNPQADFQTTQPDACGIPSTVTFTDASTNGFGYAWSFGNGETTSAPSPAVTYRAQGVYPVELIVTSPEGCLDTTTVELDIADQPVAAFDPPPPLACAPYQLRLSAAPTQARRYEWYLNDDRLPVTGPLLDTVLTNPSAYDLRLVAIWNDACRDTLDAFDLLNLEPRPVADFDYVANEDPNRIGDVRFINLSQFAATYRWDFGDGQTSREPNPIHEYRTNRSTATLFATTDYGMGLICRDSLTRAIEAEWITTFYVPNAISPESATAGVNTWGAKGFGVVRYRLEVFSPYGQLVYRTEAVEDFRPVGRWNGDLAGSGELVPQGAYTWRAEVDYVDGNRETMVGTVTVLR